MKKGVGKDQLLHKVSDDAVFHKIVLNPRYKQVGLTVRIAEVQRDWRFILRNILKPLIKRL